MREEVDFTEGCEYFKNDEFITLEPWGRRVDHLRLTILGRPDTPYEGGRFVFEIKFPEKYPFTPPYVYAVTLMWHPNIDCSIPPGKLNICLDLINPEMVGNVNPIHGASGWTPAKDLTMVIEALKGMMHMTPPFFNPEDPLNNEAGTQYITAYKKFQEKAKKWTKKYALD